MKSNINQQKKITSFFTKIVEGFSLPIPEMPSEKFSISSSHQQLMALIDAYNAFEKLKKDKLSKNKIITDWGIKGDSSV